MAFIVHSQVLRIAAGDTKKVVCNPRGAEVIQGRTSQRRALTMVDNRKRSVSNVSKLGLAVSIALSVSLKGSVAAASIVPNAHPPSADTAFTHQSSNAPRKDPTDVVLHVSAGSGMDPNRFLSSPDSLQRDVSDQTNSSMTVESFEREYQDVVEDGHQSLSQRIADRLRSRGLPDELVVFLVSALPAVELRAGVPVGFLLNVHPIKVFLLAVLGNMAPIIPLMLLLRLRIVQTLASKVLDRARKKAAAVGNANSRAAALALFVGVPLPGTGAWTGSLVAFVLGMPVGQSLAALFAGVVMAACIMTVLCAMGKVGAVFAGTVFLGAGLSSLLRANANSDEKIEDQGSSGDAAGTS